MDHLKSCLFISTVCDYCSKRVQKINMAKHQDKCEQNIKLCNSCNSYMTIKELKIHDLKECNDNLRIRYYS